jgi:hypothetical protein
LAAIVARTTRAMSSRSFFIARMVASSVGRAAQAAWRHRPKL